MNTGFGWALKVLSIAIALAALVVLALMNTIGARIGGVPIPWFGWLLWTIVPYSAGLAFAGWLVNQLKPRTLPTIAPLVFFAAAAVYVDVIVFVAVVPLGILCTWIWRCGERLVNES